ncbi:hypothetical protein COSHB9_05410 [Companilactobacillus alimentarius]
MTGKPEIKVLNQLGKNCECPARSPFTNHSTIKKIPSNKVSIFDKVWLSCFQTIMAFHNSKAHIDIRTKEIIPNISRKIIPITVTNGKLPVLKIKTANSARKLKKKIEKVI